MLKHILILLGFSTSGIGFIAEKLLTNDCDGLKWNMCNFLQRQVGDALDTKYVGMMLPDRMGMSASQEIHWYLGSGATFYKTEAVSNIKFKNGRDRVSFLATIFLFRTLEAFPGIFNTYVHLKLNMFKQNSKNSSFKPCRTGHSSSVPDMYLQVVWG